MAAAAARVAAAAAGVAAASQPSGCREPARWLPAGENRQPVTTLHIRGLPNLGAKLEPGPARPVCSRPQVPPAEVPSVWEGFQGHSNHPNPKK